MCQISSTLDTSSDWVKAVEAKMQCRTVHTPMCGPQLPARRSIIARGGNGNRDNRQRLSTARQVQPNWSDNMATIQGLMGQVQDQLVHSARISNPALAKELKAKAERHLEVLMRLAEAQQQQHIQGNSPSGDTLDLQQLLQELQVQLELEQQAMLTASTIPAAPSTNTSPSSSPTPTPTSKDDAVAQQQELELERAHAAADALQERLASAEAEAINLRNQLSDTQGQMRSIQDELKEHRDLQMAYDKQCQDLYRLRMQLQLVRSQGNDAEALAAQANKQHKQDLAWLMDAHRKELRDAHTKNRDLVVQVQQLRLKVLEQDQLVWSLGGTAAGQQQQQQRPQQQDDQQALQQQEQVQQQLQQVQESAQQLTAEKQQLSKQLQDSQREQALLLVELQTLRTNAEGASAAGAAAAAVEQELQAQLVKTQQQRDSLQQEREQAQQEVQALQASLQDAKQRAEAAAAASAAAVAPAAAAAAAVVASPPGVGGVVDAAAAAAVAQLKVAKREMAGLRVQLANARRELREASGRATAAESALQQQAASFEARLAKLQQWYNRQAAVVAQLRRGKAPKDGQLGFTNTNKFWVRHSLLFEFLKHWVSREAQLQEQEGFLGLQVQPGVAVTADGGVDVTVSSLWESIPAWEAWSKSAAGTQQHIPTGVYQYVPAKGEGFPEAFVPFRDYDAAVNAKY